MFEVRRGSSRAAEHGRIERAATRSEEREHSETAADLEAQVVDVVVRNAVAGDVDERAEQQCERPRARERAGRGPRRDVKRDDHVSIIAYAPGMSLGNWFKRLFSPTRTNAPADIANDEETTIDEARIAAGGGSMLGGNYAAMEAESVVEGELSEEEPPSDPAP